MCCEGNAIACLRSWCKYGIGRTLPRYGSLQANIYAVLVWAIILSEAVLPSHVYARTHTMHVFVSIEPQAYFVHRIAGQHVQVHVLVRQGQSPHVFEPTPRQIALLKNADLYFTVGLPFERQLTKKILAVRTRLKCVDTTKGIPFRKLEGHTHHSDDHESADPHIWLSPELIKIQATTIAEALCTYDSGNADFYRENLKKFHADLHMLDSEIKAKLSPFAGRDVFVFHPAFGYFTDAYGLRQVAIEADGKEPGSRSLTKLVEHARAQKVRVIFAEQQFSRKTADALAWQIGAEVVTLDPLARDCLENLRHIADRFIYAFEKQ